MNTHTIGRYIPTIYPKTHDSEAHQNALALNLFTEYFGIHVLMCNFAPHFGVEYSLNCEGYLSHALYNAPVSVENCISLPDKPRYFQPDRMPRVPTKKYKQKFNF